jgi:hypothetical protein
MLAGHRELREDAEAGFTPKTAGGKPTFFRRGGPIRDGHCKWLTVIIELLVLRF